MSVGYPSELAQRERCFGLTLAHAQVWQGHSSRLVAAALDKKGRSGVGHPFFRSEAGPAQSRAPSANDQKSDVSTL
jgi:hypothetical protein